MKEIALRERKELEELFLITAREIDLPEAMVEKDFWVCWTLDYLFHDCPWAEHLAFKGGTSLFKCFGLIQRFSEDIDLILDWRLLGYEKDEPWVQRSKTQQDRFNKSVNAKTEEFLRETFLPQLQTDFQKLLGDEFFLCIEEDDPQTVCFGYPKSFQEGSILPVVRLEIGALAAWTPVKQAKIASYAAQQYPKVFKHPTTSVLTVAPERTFWEKVTILHKEAFRINGRFPARYSRHYYDLWCMDKSPVKTAAYEDLALLERVVRFKERFYPTGSAHYELARPETMKLLPPTDCLPILREDYEHMKNMIFGETPEFEEIMECMERLEREINGG